MSAPQISSIFNILNTHSKLITGKPLGFINPLLYSMYDKNIPAFTDIIQGNNINEGNGNCYGYQAVKGYDAASGLGSVNYNEILQYIQTLAEIRNMKSKTNIVVST